MNYGLVMRNVILRKTKSFLGLDKHYIKLLMQCKAFYHVAFN